MLRLFLPELFCQQPFAIRLFGFSYGVSSPAQPFPRIHCSLNCCGMHINTLSTAANCEDVLRDTLSFGITSAASNEMAMEPRSFCVSGHAIGELTYTLHSATFDEKFWGCRLSLKSTSRHDYTRYCREEVHSECHFSHHLHGIE